MYAIFTFISLLSPQASNLVPFQSKIFYKGFYEIYQGQGNEVIERDGTKSKFLSLEEAEIKPMKFFAFGLGNQGPIDPEIGKFVARIKSADADGNETLRDLGVSPCNEIDFTDKDKIREMLEVDQSFESLYCLENYSDYELDYQVDYGASNLR